MSAGPPRVEETFRSIPDASRAKTHPNSAPDLRIQPTPAPTPRIQPNPVPRPRIQPTPVPDPRIQPTPVPDPRIYFAATSHRRNTNAPGAVSRTFTYSTCYWLVDVDDLPDLPLLLRTIVRFQASDHLGKPTATIADNVRAALTDNGLTADRILLLTCPRVAGHVFNPLSVFYCFSTSEGAVKVVAVIAEVHNTYGGRHVYVLRPDGAGRDAVDKQFYVSPFLPMGGSYLMRTPVPDEKLAVSIALRQGGQTPFVATLTGRGRPVTTRSVVTSLLRWPLLTLRTSALIRWQGIRLWLRRVPVQPRPPDATSTEHGR